MKDAHMQDICIDTQILFAADNAECCQRDVLLLIEQCGTVAIALEKTIIQEYSNKMRAERFGQHWLRMMATTGRTVLRGKTKLPRGILRELLDKIHFDPNDIMFLEVALSTDTKVLVAEEDDFSVPVRKLMSKKMGLSIRTSPEYSDHISPNLNPPTVSTDPCK